MLQRKIISILYVLLISSCFLTQMPACTPPNQTAPNVVGLLEGDAATAINAAGLVVGNRSEELSETVRFGRIITQSPVAGAAVQSGHGVDLVISMGKTAETVRRVIQDVRIDDPLLPEEIETDADGRDVARTRLTIVYYLTATATEINDLLASLSATVVNSLKGTRSMVVRIPDPGTLAAYNQIVANIEAEDFVQFVIDGTLIEPAMLPDNYTTTPPDLAKLKYIDHHIAVNAAPAWNARAAIKQSPQVLIMDYFGSGPPSVVAFNYHGDVSDFAMGELDPDTNLPWEHGYEVLSIIAGDFGEFAPIGMYPDTIDLRVIDISDSADWGMSMHDLLWVLLENMPGKLVLNTSLGYGCTGTGGDCIDINEVRLEASLWIELVDHFDLEGRVLHLTAANNIENPPGAHIRDARTASEYAAARLLGGLSDSEGNALSNLTNTLVVESALNDNISETTHTVASCLSDFSFVNGDIAGIGTDVWSIPDPTGYNFAEGSGTSFSTPQVAGLAAYCWSIAPQLTPQELINLLLDNCDVVPGATGGGGCSDWAEPSPVINAYNALLSLDAAAPPTAANAPVRHAILDVNEDDVFDQDDLEVFVTKYFGSTQPDALFIEPEVLDYSRYDLNGDGWTGGTNDFYFDLDRSTSVQYGPTVLDAVITQDIAGTTVSYQEEAVTDLDVLCYCAYSGLYEGNETERDTLLEDRCIPMMRVFAGVDGGENPAGQYEAGFASASKRLDVYGDEPVHIFEYSHAETWLPGFDIEGDYYNHSTYEILPGVPGGGSAVSGNASADSSYSFDGTTLTINATTSAEYTGQDPAPDYVAMVGYLLLIEINNPTQNNIVLEITHTRDVTEGGDASAINYFEVHWPDSAGTEQYYFYDSSSTEIPLYYESSSGTMELNLPPGINQILQHVSTGSRTRGGSEATSFQLEFSIGSSK